MNKFKCALIKALPFQPSLGSSIFWKNDEYLIFADTLNIVPDFH